MVNPPEIKRLSTWNRLLERIPQEFIVLHGPSMWGKSWFLKRQLPQLVLDADIFDEVFYFDLFSKRIHEGKKLERELLYSKFRNEENLLGNFIISLDEYYKAYFIKEYLDWQYKHKSVLIIFDNVNVFNLKKNESLSWLNLFTEYSRKRGHGIIFATQPVWLNELKERDKKVLSKFNEFKMDPLTDAEIDAWLQEDFFTHYYPSITRQTVIDASARLVSFARDFSFFIRSLKFVDKEVSHVFNKYHSDKYIRQCHNLLNTRRSIFKGAVTFTTEEYNSGCFVNNECKLACPACVAARMEILNSEENRMYLMCLGSQDVSNIPKNIPLEIVTEILKETLLFYDNYQILFSKFQELLRHLFGVNCLLYVRDSSQTQIWYELLNDFSYKKILLNHKNSDFVEIAHQGYWKTKQSGEVLFSVVGGTGKVDLILQGKIPTRKNRNIYEKRIHIRSIWNVINQLQCVLIHGISDFNRRIEKKENLNLEKRTKELTSAGKDSFEHLLKEVDGDALIILRCSDIKPDGRWTTDTFYSLQDDCFVESQFSTALNEEALSRVFRHPRRRSVILKKQFAIELFAKIKYIERDFSIHVESVKVSKGIDSKTNYMIMVVFLADGSGKEIISGAKSSLLSLISHRMLQLSFFKSALQIEHEKELNFFYELSEMMPQFMFHPSAVESNLISLVSQYFNARAVAIYDIIENDKKEKKCIWRCGGGYDLSYHSKVYGMNEGKTGYIASQGKILVSTKSAGELEAVKYYNENTHTLELCPGFEKYEAQCVQYLTNASDIKNFIGAPIAINDRSDQKVSLGLIKFSNSNRNFTLNDVELAKRISNFLAPFMNSRMRIRMQVHQDGTTTESLISQIRHEMLHSLRSLKLAIPECVDPSDGNYADCMSHIESLEKIVDACKGCVIQSKGEQILIGIKKELESIFSTYKFDFENKHVDIKMDVDATLQCHMDVNYFRSVFKNLIMNSMESFTDGTVKRILVYQKRSDKKSHQIVFEDYGCGVPMNLRNKIFQLLITTKQSDTSREKRGQGLSYVKGVLEISGGEINLDNCKNPTRFVIKLPKFV
ncbi:ATP-binding protein [Desulfovibrio inopinatus]|uniref:sensor histidine kinase n=1 Tax=Desulfovibrio inopinatus TaxID=102109 RepID=UPI000418BD1A|nr:ATP-binding protein [Desulfovibrio inopinatus]